MAPDCPPPPEAVVRVDAFRAAHAADHGPLRVKDLRDATVNALRRINRELGEMIDALRDENRRLREDYRQLEQSAQDRPGRR